MSTTPLRKRVGDASAPPVSRDSSLDVASIATIEITSEAAGHGIEHALDGTGWRAGTPGRQTIRVVFDEPQRLEHIGLEFEELTATRTQEIALDWVGAGGERRNIVRQRWNFSPSGSTREVEDFRVELSGIRALEIVIDPDVSDKNAVASLQRLRLR